MRLISTVCLFLLLAPAPWAQPQKEEEPLSIKVDVDVVQILCSVRDKRGALIGNLTKDDFTLFEDGKQQEIKYFAKETDLPLTIGLLVDVSGSQARLIQEERQAAYQFFSQVLRKKDMAFLISFGPEAELLQDFTNSPRLLQTALDGLKVSSAVGGLHPGPVPTASRTAGTVLFDAVYLAASDRLHFSARPTDDDGLAVCGDISAARRELGYVPATPLRTGIARTVRWWRESAASRAVS